MSSRSPPLFSSLQKYLQTGLQRCLDPGSSANGDGQAGGSATSCFFAYIAEQQNQPEQHAPHPVMELEEVLIQVFRHLDSRALCTHIPLVCHKWREVATADQVWLPRLDPQLLHAAKQHQHQHHQQQQQQQQQPIHTAPGSSSSSSSSSSSIPGTPPAACPVRLPLLHHAVYGSNLLRNPSFAAAANADYSSLLARARSATTTTASSSSTTASSSSSSRAAQRPPALLTTAQRRFAWVTTVGTPLWEQLPAGPEQQQQQQQQLPPPPLPYPAAASASPPAPRLHTQLQQWLFGRAPPPPVASPPPPVAAASGSGGGTGGISSSSSSGGGSSGHHGHQVAARPALSCLASGRSWTEVVQVIDLMSELTLRGLDPHTAAAVLDSGCLALGFSVWVAPAGAAAAAAAATQQHHDDEQQQQQQRYLAHAGPPAAAAAVEAQFGAALMLDDGAVHLRSFQTFVAADSSHHFFSKRLALRPADGWRRYAYLLPSCPKGVRRAVVLLRGRGPGPRAATPFVNAALSGGSSAAVDTRVAGIGSSSIAGSSGGGSGGSGSGGGGGGVRFASAQLSFVRQADVEEFGAEACLEGWVPQVVQGL